jgi:hypothetical protein
VLIQRVHCRLRDGDIGPGRSVTVDAIGARQGWNLIPRWRLLRTDCCCGC